MIVRARARSHGFISFIQENRTDKIMLQQREIPYFVSSSVAIMNFSKVNLISSSVESWSVFIQWPATLWNMLSDYYVLMQQINKYFPAEKYE